MTDLFFIILLIVIIGVFGIILYLIYIPFKNQLTNSGKLTKKLRGRINWTFITLLILMFVFFYCIKDYRTSSKYRLEKASDVKLPENFKILNDEYQDMLQDYCIVYDIQFDNEAKREFINNIKDSKYFNENSFHDNVWKNNDTISIESNRAVWSKSSKGFDFTKQDGSTSYTIEFNTTTNVLKYNECAD